MTEAISPEARWPFRYFQLALLVFIASFLLLPTAKMVNNVYYVGIAIPALIALATGHGRYLIRSPIVLLWTLFLCWRLIAVGASGEFQDLKHLTYVTLFLLVVGYLTKPDVFRSTAFMRSMFWVVALYIVCAVFYYSISGRYAPGQHILWLLSRMDGSIYTSMWLTACFFLATPVWIKERRYLEFALAVTVSLILLAYVLQCRSALLAWLVVGMLMSAHSASASPRVRISAALVGIAIAVTFAVALATVPQISALVQRADSGRFEIWTILLGEWQSCGWLTGCGLGHKSIQTLAGGYPILHPHNIYLTLGLTTGVPGLLLFLAIAVTTLRLAWTHRDPWGLYLTAGLVALFFDGSTIIDNPDERWLLVLLPMALIANPYGRARPPTHG